MTAPRRAVLSLLNTPAGLFRWYEQFPLAIGEQLQQAGIEHVLGYKAYLDNTIVPPPHLPAHDMTDMPDRQWVARTLEPIAARYDELIVHTHSFHFGATCQVWRMTRGHRQRRWWATMHRTPSRVGLLRSVPRRMLQAGRIIYPDRLFGCSAASTAALRRMFLPGRVATLLNGRLSGADLTRFEPRGEPHRALFVGRLNREKGVWPLLEAGRQLAQIHPRFELVILGEGPEEEAMRRWIEEHGLARRIRMPGHDSDVGPYYRQADFVVVPTDPQQIAEGLPLVALEAQGHALPVLYSLSGGLPETQIEGATGLRVDPLDAPTLVSRATELMADPDRYQAMRLSIRDSRQRWSLQRMVDDYCNAYVDAFRQGLAKT